MRDNLMILYLKPSVSHFSMQRLAGRTNSSQPRKRTPVGKIPPKDKYVFLGQYHIKCNKDLSNNFHKDRPSPSQRLLTCVSLPPAQAHTKNSL